MTHLEFLTLFSSFTIEGQESSFKLPNTTKTPTVVHLLMKKNRNHEKDTFNRILFGAILQIII